MNAEAGRSDFEWLRWATRAGTWLRDNLLDVLHSNACVQVAIAERQGDVCMARSKQLQADYWRRRLIQVGAVRALLVLTFMAICVGCHAAPPPTAPPPERNAATLYGDVDQDVANKVIGQIQDANEQDSIAPIFLYINSRGGDILAGGMIVDAMTASRRPVYTVAIGQAASMAAVIHSYGAQRYMAPHAVLMFHNASMGAQDELPHMIQRVTLIYRMWSAYEQHIADRAGMPLDEFRAHEASQWWLTAQDAIDSHMADGIGSSPRYPVN